MTDDERERDLIALRAEIVQQNLDALGSGTAVSISGVSATAAAGALGTPPAVSIPTLTAVEARAGAARAGTARIGLGVFQPNAVQPSAFQVAGVTAPSGDLNLGREAGAYSIEGSPAGLVVRRAARTRRSATRVGKAVLRNHVPIESAAAAFVLLIDARLEQLRADKPNSDEAIAARGAAIADCEDLKRRVDRFLDSVAGFSSEKVEEPELVKDTISFKEGLGRWWTKRHVEAMDTSLFLIGVSICWLAGGGPLAIAIPGVLVGGNRVVEIVKAVIKGDDTDGDDGED